MKRLAKIFLAVLLFFLVAILGLTIYVKVKYPPERLRQLLISYLQKEYQLRVAIARLDFNLFSGFELDAVAVLGATNDLTTFDHSPFTVQKIKFSYRWRSLLARRLDIDEVTIQHPAVFYKQAPDSSSNLDVILAAFTDSSTTPNDTSSTGLPISIHLNALHLHDLQIKAVLASRADTQNMELGPIGFTLNEIEIDRQAHFSGKFKLSAEPANFHYTKIAFGQRDSATTILTQIQSQISGSFIGDSVVIDGALTLNRSQIKWKNETEFSLPRLGTTAQVRYDFASSQLEIPEVRLLIDDEEQLAARFEMNQQNGLSAFALRVNRGTFDLAQVLNLARTHGNRELRDFLRKIDCAGELEFSGSELKSDEQGMVYELVVAGRDLVYKDDASGFKITRGRFELNSKTASDSSDAIAGKFHVETFDVPVDTKQTLKTGPLEFTTTLALAKDLRPQRGDLEWSWKNFSEGKINGRLAIKSSSAPIKKGSWLSQMMGEAVIAVDAMEISPFAANAASGKIGGKITLAGKLADSDLTFHLYNSIIPYETMEYKGRIPSYHLSASAKLRSNLSLTKFSLPNGKLQVEPAQASFNAFYDLQADTFRFNLPDLAIDLAQVRQALPDTILAGMNYAKIKGRAGGNGWLRGRFLEFDSLDYNGVFALHSADAAYVDSVLGIYTDSLRISSEWLLTPNKTIGKYTVACSTPRLPDYLRQPLPPTKAAGKLIVDETTFTITGGKFDIPDWQAAGSYRVDGEFRPAGIQVKTTVDLDMHAPKPITINRGVTWRGDLEGQFIIDQYIPEAKAEPQPSRLNGWFRSEGMDIQIDTVFALQGFKANCRFSQDFDLFYLAPDSTMAKGMKLEPEPESQPYLVLKTAEKSSAQRFTNAGEALLMYDLFRANAGERSWLAIEKINLFGYQLSNLAADLNLGNCRFDIPKFNVNLFDGNLMGNFLAGLGNGNPDSISYATTMQIASIDVSHFRRLRAQLGGKQSRLSADFFLSGLGAAPAKLEAVVNDLAGRLNITKIENKVASNLLQMLDPNSTDKGIQNMRLLMKTRWNVKQLTFEIKNGFVYASLAHVKPWYAPFKLPQPLDFARFPVKPYLGTSFVEED